MKSLAGVVTLAQVAEIMGVSVATVRRWLRDGHLPQPATLGRTKVWNRRRLVSFLATKAMKAEQAAAASKGPDFGGLHPHIRNAQIAQQICDQNRKSK